MNFPIPVNLTVAQNNVPVNITVSDNSESIGFDIETQIVVSEASEYEGPYTVTPSESVQTLETANKKLVQDVTVEAAPPAVLESYHEFTVSPYGTPDENGVINVKGSNTRGYFPVEQSGWVSTSNHIAVSARIDGSIQLPTQSGETITPTESEQTAVASGKYTTGQVKVGAIPSSYVGSGVPQKSSSDMTALGATVTAPAGYYAEEASKSVSSGSASTPNTSIPVHMDVSLSATGLITATVNGSQSVTPNVVEGYVDRGTAGTVSVYSLKKVQLPTQEAKTVTPTETEQTAVAAQKYTTGEVKVAAIPSDYIGSDVPQKSSSDLTASGATVTAPAGYYSTDAQKTIPDATYSNNITIGIEPYINVTTNGLIGVSKDEVSALHPVTSGGYAATTDTLPVGVWAHNSLQLDTQAGTTITPTEQEQTAVAAQKYTTGEVKVGAISSSYVGSGVARNDSTDLSVSGATVTAPAGYYENAASASVPNATWKSASTVGVVPDISVDSSGLITANCAGWTSIHPLTASGYADSDTAANIQLSGVKTSQLSTQAAQTITPTTTNQTIASGKYLTGAQTILGDANLVPESIVENITIFGVTGNAPPPVTVVHLI